MEPIYFSNRSAAYYNIDQFEKALEDANHALQLDPKYLKAHFRKAASLYELNCLSETKEAIENSQKYGDYADIEKLSSKMEKEIQLVPLIF